MKRKVNIFLIWFIPIIAFGISGLTLYTHYKKQGPLIKVEFASAEGIIVGKTDVKYHGIPVGKVIDETITEDLRKVVLIIRLKENASHIARRGSKFYIVRSKTDIGDVQNLETIVSGAYVSVELPKKLSTSRRTYFKGIEDKATTEQKQKESDNDLAIKIEAPHLFSSTMAGSSIYYKGIPVGFVKDVVLKDRGEGVIVEANIKEKYSYLVRTNSLFWDIKAINLDWKVLKGVNIQSNSSFLETILKGGIAFATPEVYGLKVKNNHKFVFQNEPLEDEWSNWTPYLNK